MYISSLKSHKRILFSQETLLFIKICFCIIFFFTIIQAVEKTAISTAFFAIYAFGVVLLAANPRLGILFYIAVCLLGTDTPLINATSPLISIHTVGLGGMALMPIYTLSVLGFLVIFLLYKGRIVYEKNFDSIMFSIGGLFLIAGIIGLHNLSHGPRIYISDASWYINMITSYLAVRLFFRKGHDLKLLVMVVIACLGVQAFAGIIFYIFGVGAVSANVVKPVMDSARNLFPLLVILGFSVYYMPRVSLTTKTIIVMFGFSGVFNVLTYASRGNMILTTFAILLLLVLLHKPQSKNIELSRKIKRIIFPSVVFVAASLLAMHFIRPGSLNFIIWKLKSTLEIGDADILSSANVRWLEFQNIVAHLWNNGSILWGEGLAGYFTDDYKPFAMNLLDGSAFKNQWILANTLYKPHGSQLFILLKMGVGGAFIYFALLFLFFVRCWKAKRYILFPFWLSVFTSLLAFLPLIYYKNFNSKLQVFMGIVMAVLVNIIHLSGHKKSIINPHKI